MPVGSRSVAVTLAAVDVFPGDDCRLDLTDGYVFNAPLDLVVGLWN